MSDTTTTAVHDSTDRDAEDLIQPSVVRTRIIPAIALLMVVGLVGLLIYSIVNPDRTNQINSAGFIELGGKREAPDFTLATFDGGQFTLSEQRGKIVIVNFWASWCEPCREEMPLLVTADASLPDDVIMVGVNVRDDEAAAREFLARYQATYPSGPDPGERITIDYGVTGFPETFIVDAEGRLVARLPGAIRTMAQLRAMIDEARVR